MNTPTTPPTPDTPDSPDTPDLPDTPATQDTPVVPQAADDRSADDTRADSLADDVFADDEAHTRAFPTAAAGPAGPASTGTTTATTVTTVTAPAQASATPATAAPPEPEWIKGPAPFALVLGLLGLVVAVAVLVSELADVSVPWDDLGPWSVVAAGVVVLLVGAIGLRSSRARD